MRAGRGSGGPCRPCSRTAGKSSGVRQQKEVQEKADLWRSEGGVGKYSVTEAKGGSGVTTATFSRERSEDGKDRDRGEGAFG